MKWTRNTERKVRTVIAAIMIFGTLGTLGAAQARVPQPPREVQTSTWST